MLQNALVTLEGWLNSLPPSMLISRPGLISLRGPLLAMKGNLHESKNLLDTAVTIYKKNRDIGGLTLALTRRAHTLRLLGNYRDSLTDIKEALRLAESNPIYQPLYAEALRIQGLNLYRLGKSRQAVEALEHSLSLFTALNETGSIPMLFLETGMVYRATGNTEAAALSYLDALKIWQKENNFYYQAEVLNNLAVLYQQLGQYAIAAETFENGLACARKSRNRRVEALILTGLGDLYSEVEEFKAAINAYQQADMIARDLTGTFISNYLVLANGHLALLQSDLPKANAVLGVYRKKIKISQSNYERALWELFEGRYRILNGEYKKAIRLLQECKLLFTQDGRDLEIHMSVIWLAVAYEQARQRGNACLEIEESMDALANPDHAILVTVMQAGHWLKNLQDDARVGRQLNNLLEKSRNFTLQLPAIRRSLRRHAQSIQMSSAYLNIRAFGRAEVKVQGRSVTMSEWRTQSVRDLFFYFLFKQDAVTKEQIGAVLWPEIGDPQLLKARFKNEIYRLRRAIGRDIVIFDEESYRFNRTLDYEYDVEAFESHLLRARKASDRSEKTEHFQKAVDIADGFYLAEVDSVWTQIERERLGQMYVSALEELAKLYLDENRLELCLSVCQQILDRDRYHELAYQLEMRAYAALGDRSAIARLYRACKAALHNDLGIALSKETEALFHELTL
jgi:two-component SAPR family response regulator/predicted negative regulator of RcsB-dependent stress response